MDADLSLLEQYSRDRALAAEVLFAHRHPQASADFHVRFSDLWGCADEFVLFEAFREAGKTSKAEENFVLEGAYGNFPYALIVGETYSKACQRLEAIAKEAQTNEKLKRLFGGNVLGRKPIENRIWFKSGAMIEAWGWEQELQSFKYHDFRPSLVYLDDIENQERVRDKAAVDAGMRKFWLELLPALDKTRRRIRFGQTRRAEDCMVTRFAANPEWLYYGVPICDGDIDDPATRSNWPERYPMEWIRAERNRYQAAGMLSEFLQAYMLQAINPDEKPFREDMFGIMDVSPWHWMPRYAIYDPSRTSNERSNRSRDLHKSDRTGKVVVSRIGSRILVHESAGYFWQPDELINDLFATYEQHHPAKIGIEKNSLDDWILQPIRLSMLKRGVALPLTALQAPQDRSKEQFILGLQPFAHAKDIVLVGGKSAHAQLVAEWSNFPKGPRDILNALAYALKMFGGALIYDSFAGDNIADAPEPARGEDVYVGFCATPAEAVAVAVVRTGRRLAVYRDWAISGAPAEAVRSLAFELRTTFPGATIQAWAPAELHDQWQRVALIPALRAAKLTPYRGEHTAVARGCLAERMSSTWRNAKLLTVDKRATLTLNALAAGYAFPAESGGRQGSSPEQGVSRLIAEALETMVAMLDRQEDSVGGFPKNANLARTPGGQQYVTANPRHR